MLRNAENSPRSPLPTLTALVVLMFLVTACGTVQHGRQTAAIAGQSLATGSAPGSDRLASEIDYDSAVRDAIREQGRPDYLHVVNRDDLFLFYTRENRVLQVRRNLIPPGVVTEFAPIPGHLLNLLPAVEIERAKARLAKKKASGRRVRRTRVAKAPPAALAPDSGSTGKTLNRFDLRELVGRFRTPISAADAGVQGWRVQTLRDGTRSGYAKSRNLEYRIRANSVSVTSPIASRGNRAPGDIRIGYYRVNKVVFGTRAHAISGSVASLVAKVAADPSGRTRIVRRVAGRSLHIIRDPVRGTLLYQIGTD
jgi:hypothetical protein